MNEQKLETGECVDEESIWLYKPYYCPICGKEFYPTPQWVYRRENTYYCTWKCFRAAEKEREKAYHIKPIEQLNLEGEVVAEFKSAYEAAAAIDCSISGLRYACQKGLKYKKHYWRYKEDGVSEVSQ